MQIQSSLSLKKNKRTKTSWDYMASNIVNLPDEVLELIFFKLPSSSLIRCKSVSRAWNDLISNLRFVHQQYMAKNLMAKKRECTSTSTTFLVYRCQHWHSWNNYFTVVSMSHAGAKLNSTFCIPYFAHDPHIFLSEPELVYPAGYGIYCLFQFGYMEKKVVLWNPTIRELMELPYPSLHLESGFYEYGFAQVEYYKDNGFSYKVGLMHITHNSDNDSFCLSIDLYSSSENSWKLFQHVYYGIAKGLNGKCHHHGTNLNGKFYFLPWFYGEGRSIVTFDMTTHEFGSVKVPSFVADDPAYDFPDLVLTKFDEKSLCLLIFKGNIHEANLEAWVYLEHNESWILKSSVKGIRSPMEVSVFGINTSSTCVLFKHEDKLCYCRYGSGQVEILPVVMESNDYEFNQIVEYEESIVSLTGNYL